MKKLRDDKITASRKLAVVPSHCYSNFSISVSQAAAHWLQLGGLQGLVFWYSKMRLAAQCVGIAANAIRLCVRAAIPNILALQINLISRLTYSRCYGGVLIQNQNDSNSKISSSNLLRRGSS